MRIWVIRQSARREPKFHHAEMFEGAGRSISESFTIFRMGWVLRRFAIRVLVVE